LRRRLPERRALPPLNALRLVSSRRIGVRSEVPARGRYRLGVRTRGSQPRDRGSNPRTGTIFTGGHASERRSIASQRSRPRLSARYCTKSSEAVSNATDEEVRTLLCRILFCPAHRGGV